MKTTINVFLFSLLIILSSCHIPDDKGLRESEIVKIEAAINSSIGWAVNKDFELLFSIISNDSNFLEVHPNGRLVQGFEEFKKLSEFWKNPDFQAVGHDVKDLKINLSEHMDVAWFYCILNDYNTWQGEPANWENARWTGVMEKRNGSWVTVQQHFSFASNK